MSDKLGPSSYQKVIQDLEKLISLPLYHDHLFKKLNLKSPRGILLSGPAGVGKTYLVKKLTEKYNANLTVINGSEIYSPYLGESEGQLREKFNLAFEKSLNPISIEENKANLLFIDEIDALAPKRTTLSQSITNRIVAQLLTLMDDLHYKHIKSNLVVIAATNRPDDIDSALRRPGRFDLEVSVDMPTIFDRVQLLNYHTKSLSIDIISPDQVNFVEVAKLCNGYVAADIAMLCREVSILADKNDFTVIQQQHFVSVLNVLRPSTLRHFSFVSPTPADRSLSLESIVGLRHVKKQLKRHVLGPVLDQEKYTRLGLQPDKGVIFYGPPGCSKTTLVKVVANLTKFALFTLNGAQVYSSYLGESEKTIRQAFERARRAAPAILFLDEIDALVGKRHIHTTGQKDPVRERILATMLNEMDGVKQSTSILVMGATNRLDQLDDAMLRPGRFDRKIYVGPPTHLEDRLAMLHHFSKHLPMAPSLNLTSVAGHLNDYFTGADIKNLCREASLLAIRQAQGIENDVQVELNHFEQALKFVRPTLNEEIMRPFQGL